MRKIDWVLLGLFLLNGFYTWKSFNYLNAKVWNNKGEIAQNISEIKNHLDVHQDCEAKWDAEINGIQNKLQQIDDRTKYTAPSYGGEF